MSAVMHVTFVAPPRNLKEFTVVSTDTGFLQFPRVLDKYGTVYMEKKV